MLVKLALSAALSGLSAALCVGASLLMSSPVLALPDRPVVQHCRTVATDGAGVQTVHHCSAGASW